MAGGYEGQEQQEQHRREQEVKKRTRMRRGGYDKKGERERIREKKGREGYV